MSRGGRSSASGRQREPRAAPRRQASAHDHSASAAFQGPCPHAYIPCVKLSSRARPAGSQLPLRSRRAPTLTPRPAPIPGSVRLQEASEARPTL